MNKSKKSENPSEQKKAPTIPLASLKLGASAAAYNKQSLANKLVAQYTQEAAKVNSTINWQIARDILYRTQAGATEIQQALFTTAQAIHEAIKEFYGSHPNLETRYAQALLAFNEDFQMLDKEADAIEASLGQDKPGVVISDEEFLEINQAISRCRVLFERVTSASTQATSTLQDVHLYALELKAALQKHKSVEEVRQEVNNSALVQNAKEAAVAVANLPGDTPLIED